MDKIACIAALSALGHETRLDVFRLLVGAGGHGLLAGEIGQRLDVRQNTMSAHLGVLHQSGLVRNRREGRAVRYFVDFAGIRALLGFLMEDCCGGRPDLCQPVIDEIACAADGMPDDHPQRTLPVHREFREIDPGGGHPKP